MDVIENFVAYLKSHIGDAYVWGGQGEKIPADNAGKLRDFVERRETKSENVNRVLEFVKHSEKRPLYAFDCSGLIINYLLTNRHIGQDYTANGIYKTLCHAKGVNDAAMGDCIFKHSGGKISHVGVYIGNNMLIEARGRDYGVVCRPYNPQEWDYAGSLNCLKTEVVLKITHPYMRGLGVKYLQMALNSLGYNAGDEDGIYGPSTQSALKRFIDYGVQ